MEIKLDDPKMQEVISAAILKEIDDSSREVMIAKALKFIMEKPSKGQYGYSEVSPLEQAFNNAVREVAIKVAFKELEENVDLKNKLKDLLNKSVNELIENETSTVRVIADAIADAMKKRDGY